MRPKIGDGEDEKWGIARFEHACETMDWTVGGSQLWKMASQKFACVCEN